MLSPKVLEYTVKIIELSFLQSLRTVFHMHSSKSIRIIAIGVMGLSLSGLPALAGQCEEQFSIPWRSEVAAGKLPLNQLITINAEGVLPSGEPNAVIDRPFHNVFQGSGFILFKENTLEFFVETNNQGFLPGCAAMPFVAISINNVSAPIAKLYSGPGYLNKHIVSEEAIELVTSSSQGPMEILTAANRRFPIGESTRKALKELYSSMILPMGKKASDRQ